MRGWLAQIWIILDKDFRLEWRTRARANALFFFAFLSLLLFSFAVGPDGQALQKYGGGYLWLALLFSSVLALGESFRVEAENRALEGLLCVPVDSRAIFVGKAVANALLLFLLGLTLIPLMVVLYGVSIHESVWLLILILFLGAGAIAAPGTIFSAISSQARSRDVLLPLLLFPLLVPALISSVKATELILTGDAMSQISSWVWLLVAFDLVYWSLGFVLFPLVVEE